MEMLLGNGWYLYYTYWPIAVDKTRFVLQYFLPPAKNAAQRVSLENAEAALRDVIQEDLCTVENTQAVLRSGAITHMRLSDMEALVRYNYKVVDELVGANHG